MSDFPGKVNITDSDGNPKITLDGETGQVGINITEPKAKLHVVGAVYADVPDAWIEGKGRDGIYDEFVAGQWPGRDWPNRSERELRIQSATSGGAANQYLLFNAHVLSYTFGQRPEPVVLKPGPWGRPSCLEFHNDGHLSFLVAGDGIDAANPEERTIIPKRALLIGSTGKVGIGPLDAMPREALEVQGNVLVSGDVLLAGADCAEEFDVDESEPLEPGTVMVIGENSKLSQCCTEYDKRVAGVLSGAGDYRPGIVLGRQPSQNRRLPLALTGKVFCRVDARYASIEVGDLLTTSPTLGCAMKALEPLKAFGAVIGKALQPLREGQGLVPILVALQ